MRSAEHRDELGNALEEGYQVGHRQRVKSHRHLRFMITDRIRTVSRETQTPDTSRNESCCRGG